MPTLASNTPGWLTADTCRIKDLALLCDVDVSIRDYPHARAVEHGSVIYSSADLLAALSVAESGRPILAELASVLLSGPGVVVFERALDPSVVDRVTAVFEAIIADQRANGVVSGDHYAKPGANDRIWNALEKLALRDPTAFTAYYESEIIALISRAWLGPRYQVTSQVNVVNPGGAAQEPHRDYHVGFMTNEEAEQFPSHVHRLSPALTLQGAVAHCDMPVESGPTMFLPHSQKYEAGYLAWRLPDFRDYFAEHHVQLPLAKGDAVFFNPALFHAAGSNDTVGVRRMANLLQVSSPFGRAIETVDRQQVALAVYPALVRAKAEGLSIEGCDRVIAAAANGYAFPTNLDRDQPIGSLTPESQTDVMQRALHADWTTEQLAESLLAHANRRNTGGDN